MSRFGLEKKEEVGVLLQLSVIGEMTLGGIDILKMPLDFMLL